MGLLKGEGEVLALESIVVSVQQDVDGYFFLATV
jgi:hypothetical protein